MKKITLLVLLGLLLVVTTACKKEDEILQIGFVGTLSGTYASVGVSEMYGAQLAVKEINESGGINGMMVELIVRDDKADPVEAVKVDNELYDMGIRIIIGHSLSIVALEAVENANEKGILLLSPSIGTDLLTGLNDSLIRNVSTVYTEAHYITHEILSENPNNILFVYNEDNLILTSNHLEAFEDVLESEDYQNDSSKMKFYSENQAEKELIEQALLTGAYDHLFLVSSNIDAAPFVNFIKVNEIDTVIHLVSWAGSGILPLIETEDTDNIFAYVNFDSGSLKVKYLTFKENYFNEYGVVTDMLSVNSYDMVNLLKEAMESANSKDAMKVKSEIISIVMFEGVNGDFSIDEFGDTHREHKKQIIVDSKFVIID